MKPKYKIYWKEFIGGIIFIGGGLIVYLYGDSIFGSGVLFGMGLLMIIVAVWNTFPEEKQRRRIKNG